MISDFEVYHCMVRAWSTISIEVEDTIVVDNAAPKKNNCSVFSSPITPWPCLNSLSHRVKQRRSHLSSNAYFPRRWWSLWNTQFLIIKTTPRLCCNRQFAAKAWNKAALATTIYTNCSSQSVSFSDINYSTECLRDAGIWMSRSIMYHITST